MTHVCEKCGVEFKGPSWRIAQTRHLNRKNPCDKPEQKYIRDAKPLPEVFRHRLGEMNLQGIVAPERGFMTQVVPELLRQIFSKPENQCLVWPNLHKEELIVWLNCEQLCHVGLDKLTELVMIVVHNQVLPLLKNWSRYEDFKDWMWRTTLVDLDNNVWTGDMSRKCEYFQSIRRFIKEYFGRFPSKRKAGRDLYIASGLFNGSITL
jgi:hypothetical protein